MTGTSAQHVRRVVVGIDGSAYSTEALSWAIEYAETTGAVLEAVTTWEWPNTYGVALVVPLGYDPESDARRVLDTSLQSARESHPGIYIEPVVVQGHPAPALVEASA